MTQNNFRKEPVFGVPPVSPQNQDNEQSEVTKPVQSPYVSLRSTKAPGHTFTPVMKRPDATVEDKTADVFSVKAAKEFQFTPSTDTVNSVQEKVESVAVNVMETDENDEKEVVKPINDSFTTERVIPNVAAAATVAAGAAVAATKSNHIKEKMPPKTRRLLLVALLALALLVLFFLLKPSTPETVEELQSQQGGSLPIEFRPVDEAEAKRAEEQARAEQEAAAAAKAQEQAQAAQQEPAVAPTQTEQTMAKPAQNSQSQTQSQAVVEQPVAVKPVENKPVVVQPAIKPKTENSVVFQPETTVKQQPKAPAKTEVKTERVATPVQKEVVKTVAKPVVEKAPAKTEAVKVAPAAESANAVATKTMTVPKGVSLMQVFRDNNLNISDVNAMSKVNNVVSNLKVGERVTVRLDKNNRVVEMSIGSGGKFTRQANGSYTFK